MSELPEIDIEAIKRMHVAMAKMTVSAQELTKSFKLLGAAIRRAMPLPPMDVIAVFRMRLLWMNYGPLVIFSRSWWGWLYVLVEFKIKRSWEAAWIRLKSQTN
jgi:hypothetical protein